MKGGLPARFDREALRQALKTNEVSIQIKVGSGPGRAASGPVTSLTIT